ncbi:hypothetical protein P7K49_025612 [Saguinus oedipus]|uniref:Calponin-homology (CH) domain-containing protein n=1 Tax=Saguinus oedipus TaxID=9490 RepID=A0ABQ9UJ44_SAGOE|nr:hypothetical protein P7K49_025612 [Saguinus oedipus]
MPHHEEVKGAAHEGGILLLLAPRLHLVWDSGPHRPYSAPGLDHLLSGPGPVAGEKPPSPANMNDRPPHIHTPSNPCSLKASCPGVWLQFARSTSGLESTGFGGCQGCERLGALGHPDCVKVSEPVYSKAIVDGNLKLILGLIWTLILHYSISMPMWEDEDDEDARKQTPKQRLLGWIQNKVPQLPITNFNRDWQDGKALGALVDNCAPGLCPDWEAWDPNQPVENAREAMQQADDWLGVPQVIAPEEIVDPNVDEHSVMTYLSQFPKAKLKPGAPVRSKQLNPKKAIAYGPGIEPQGNTVLQPAHFTVQTVDAGVGEVLVYIEDPEGHTEEAKVVPNNDKDRTYAVSYVPKVAGLHKVTVLFAGQNIERSPFEVNVGMALGDANKVSARGPGLEPVGNVANKPTYFDIYTAGAGTGDVAVVIVDPQGRRDTVEVALEDKGDSTFRCTYRPVMEGPHTVHVAFAGAPITRSPFPVHVAEGKGSSSLPTVALTQARMQRIAIKFRA